MRARHENLEIMEIIAANLQDAGFSLDWGVSALSVDRRPICIVEARGYGKRFIVRADDVLTAFVELQRAIHKFAVGTAASVETVGPWLTLAHALPRISSLIGGKSLTGSLDSR
jgi:hypothetical protein